MQARKVVLMRASLVAQRVKCLPAVQETWVRSLGREDPLEKEMATYFSTLAWKIPQYWWTYLQRRHGDADVDSLGHTAGKGEARENWGSSTDIHELSRVTQRTSRSCRITRAALPGTETTQTVERPGGSRGKECNHDGSALMYGRGHHNTVTRSTSS